MAEMGCKPLSPPMQLSRSHATETLGCSQPHSAPQRVMGMERVP